MKTIQTLKVLSITLLLLYTTISFSQRCQNINIPEAPPFTDKELSFPEKDYYKFQEEYGTGSGCSDVFILTGYILKVNEQGRENNEPSICFKDEKGIIHDISYAADDLSNAERSWLPYVMIPGNKVEVSLYICGSGGFETMVNIKNLKREVKSPTLTNKDTQPVYKSDIDVDIPKTSLKKENAFAVIIGNENYNNEIDVQYAINDAKSFKKYSVNVLGIPSKQIHLILNGTYGTIIKEIEWLKKVAKIYDGEAEVYFYYAGHGMPNEKSKDAYILPIDGAAENTSIAISLNNLYNSLSIYPTIRTTIFLDACFSGASRDGMLIEGRGVAIKPKKIIPNGNLIVFTAVTGSQTAYPYDTKHHGLFSYFLMKKLKETNGDVTYGEMDAYLKKQVSRKSIITGNEQTPQTIVNMKNTYLWKTWHFK